MVNSILDVGIKDKNFPKGCEDGDTDSVWGYGGSIVLKPCVDDTVINLLYIGESSHLTMQYCVISILTDELGGCDPIKVFSFL